VSGKQCSCPECHSRVAQRHSLACTAMTIWEYATVPLLTHATKQILDQWGADGWELVTVMPGPTGEQLVAYLKRPTGSQ
jgi:hypothetical protein